MNYSIATAGRCHRLMLALLATACALPAVAVAQQSLRLPMEAHRGYFGERCLVLAKGQRLAYQFHTPYPIDFNLHHHPETGPTVFPDRLRVESQHSKRFTVASSGEYCFMATNLENRPQAFELIVHYQISGG